MRTYCTRDNVGSNIRIGSWSVSTYHIYVLCIQVLAIVWTGSTQKAAEILLLHGDLSAGHSLRSPQVPTTHDKPGCVSHEHEEDDPPEVLQG